jgi:hypothetical protein
VQTHLLAGGLESDKASAFLAAMPTAEELMPALSAGEIEAETPLRVEPEPWWLGFGDR